MHMFSKEHLTASSGIVGAAGPTAAGFALAAQYLRPEAIAVAFFGDGAVNQGMLMESLNLASVWNLPVLFVCKDDRWAITTQSSQVTAGDLGERARGLGVHYVEVDGREVEEVWEATRQAIERARSGGGPIFLHASCVHLEGHFLGYQLLRMTRNPVREMPGMAGPLVRSLLLPGGASLSERAAGLRDVLSTVPTTLRDPRRDPDNDPLVRTRAALESDAARLSELEDAIEREIAEVVSTALQESAP
jgi:pyruvate dehydrogenase E1 component alpha subunit